MAVVGIGSDLRGDDVAGILVIRNLRAAMTRPQRCRVATAGAAHSNLKNIRLFDGGTAPENLTGEIVKFKPSHILLVDAADLGLEPGSATLIEPEATAGISFSTHVLPLSILADYLKRTLPCRVMILGIQPGSTNFSTTHSRTIGQAVRRLTRLILNAAPLGGDTTRGHTQKGKRNAR